MTTRLDTAHRIAAGALFILFAALHASAAQYELAPEGSNVQFSAPVFGVSKVSGKFMRYEVRIDAGKSALASARVVAVIEMASIAAGSDSWGSKLGTAAWFNAPKYPEIRF